ncbi:MAG: ATP-binding protein [Acidobacteriia bacterium]|nr:ATP-binding protein [Terriglobia bacterium]
MSSTRPVLISIKSNWESIAERPIVGKDVLELLSSSMYVNPLSIYREYLQNAADAIEEAVALGLLSDRDGGRVDIQIDGDNRSVRIRDNGTGVPRSTFAKTLVALGASRKRGSKARGFRGVGRLGGLGYCQELIFRSRSDGEREINEMQWDCRRLKSILRDPGFDGDVEDLIRDVVRVQRTAGPDAPNHFFEVELRGIVRHGDDKLVNPSMVRDYLSQVSPVPFAPDFEFGKEIIAALQGKTTLGSVLVYLNGEQSPLFRPHRNEFQARKGVVDRFTGVRFYDIEGKDGTLAATGWILDHSYLGAIDTASFIKGVRLRSGNMQVGESDLLDHLFAEPRFNSWAVGEFHVLDERILPNGRRDHFEQNVHFMKLLDELKPIATDLTRRSRHSSLHRNALRQFESAGERVVQNTSIIRQGVIGPRERRRLETETQDNLKQMERVASHSSIGATEEAELSKRLRRILARWEKALGSESAHSALKGLRSAERRAVERVFALIYDCSSNRHGAKILIDRMLARL